MNILIACEESQRVCSAFRAKGHNAFSCDIIPCSGGHNEWHIMGDVMPLINGKCQFTTMDGVQHFIKDRWDMIVAFPPCTHLAASGAAWFSKKRADGRQKSAIEFFCRFLTADCEKVVIENPVGIISGDYIKTYFPALAEKYNLPISPTQIIQPWMFGDPFQKSTCLWIKGVPHLVPGTTVKPKIEFVEWVDKKTGKTKRQTKWFADAWYLPPEERAKTRSKTFPGVAAAMAQQWG